MIINRDLLKIKLTSEKVAFDDLKKCENVCSRNNISLADTNYFILKENKKTYSKEAEPIRI
jgi:hypothetical protein